MRFGIIGCGLIAQTQHIPNILEMPDAEIVAVCDVQEILAKRIAKKYQIPNVYTHYQGLVSRDDLDAVLVAVPPEYNIDITVDTLRAGKPLFLEKPISLTAKGAEEIVRVAKESNVILQIGYNRRYDSTYELSVEKFRGLEDMFLVRAVNYANATYVNEIYHVYGERRTWGLSDTRERQLIEQLGAAATETEKRAYHTLVGSTVHIFNAMRGIFGEPKRVVETEIWGVPMAGGGPTSTFGALLSILDYGEGTKVVVEQGLNRTRRMIEFIEACSPGGMVRLSYDDPFLQNSLTTLEILKGEEVEREETMIVASRKTSFKMEMRHFIECVKGKKAPKTPSEDALRDMKIFAGMMKNYFKKAPVELSV